MAGTRDFKRAVLALAPLLVLFLAVTASAYRDFDPAISGDYQAQLDYLRYIEQNRSVPRADQGFAFYHPPAYYASSVAVFEAVRPLAGSLTLTDAGRATATAAWALEGVVAVAVVAALGGSWLGMASAAAAVWLLPGQANVGSRLYPETMAGLGSAWPSWCWASPTSTPSAGAAVSGWPSASRWRGWGSTRAWWLSGWWYR